MSTNFNNIAILNIRGVDYRCIISKISQSDAINLLENAHLIENSGTLPNIKI